MRSLRSLPSLNALRAFEAAARNASFAQAAEELHVTPGAISHQIAALENYLGIPLFIRGTRVVTLTPAALAALPDITAAFERLQHAMRQLRPSENEDVLTVSIAPAFASRWLLPRLPSFATLHPDIELRLSTGLELIDAMRADASFDIGEPAAAAQDVDFAIRFGRGQYPGQKVDKLFDVSVSPVCSPRLMDGDYPLRTPGDLRHHSLLHADTAYFDDDRPDWKVWLDAAGVKGLEATRGPRFSHTALALDAAADGMGVALGMSVLTAPDLQAGRLVAPFALRLPSHFAYWLVHADQFEERPKLAAFRAWLLDEAAASASADRPAAVTVVEAT